MMTIHEAKQYIYIPLCLYTCSVVPIIIEKKRSESCIIGNTFDCEFSKSIISFT